MKKRFGRISTDWFGSRENTLNALLNAEADAICQASRYQLIERYKTKQSCIEEVLIEMYLAGVSIRRV